MAELELRTSDPFLTNEYSVEVTLTGDQFDPAKASAILGTAPTKSGCKGEARKHGQNDTTWETNFWSREISSRDDVNQCRDHHISCLIDDIEPHIGALQEAGLERIYFYFTLSSSIGLLNVKLNPATMGRLSTINADLYISCFDCFNPNHAFWQEETEISTDNSAS